MRHLPADGRQLTPAIDGAELDEALPAVIDGTRVRHVDEREFLEGSETQMQHAQDDAGQRSAPDFRVGEFRALIEIIFTVQPVTDAR